MVERVAGAETRRYGVFAVCGVAAKTCALCGTAVAKEVSKKKYDGGWYHRTCFVCSVCGKGPSKKAMRVSGGAFFCKRHLKAHLKANPDAVDETKPWEELAPAPASSSANGASGAHGKKKAKKGKSEGEAAADAAAAAPDAAGCEPVVCGWLTKQGHLRKSWRRRWFVLAADSELSYYAEDDGTAAPKGSFNIAEGATLAAAEIKNHPHAFKLTSAEGKAFLISADSAEEYDKWIAALNDKWIAALNEHCASSTINDPAEPATPSDASGDDDDAEPEPESEVAAEPEPQPAAEPESEAAAAPEPESEAAAALEPEPEATAELEPQAAAEPEVATEPKPTLKPEAAPAITTTAVSESDSSSDDESDDDYAIGQVLDVRIKQSRLQYLVTFKGFPDQPPFWEFADDLDAEDAIRHFNLRVSSDYKRRRSSVSMSIDDWEMLGELGRGAFGRVDLAKKRDDRSSKPNLYAIKTISKKSIVDKDELEHTQTEAVVLRTLRHPALVRMHLAFQTAADLHFVMEYVEGGDLVDHWKAAGKFDEASTQFYAAEVLAGLDHLHQHGIIHRDVKLENLLLDSSGHVKICDFGLAKGGLAGGQTTRTLCGTFSCLAPEVVLGEAYGQAVDIWGLGVVMYQMITGELPFPASDRNELFNEILNNEVSLPDDVSPAAADLIVHALPPPLVPPKASAKARRPSIGLDTGNETGDLPEGMDVVFKKLRFTFAADDFDKMGWTADVTDNL
ncbi:AGC/AKT protein kinase [Thecamonas trahens ATCC 50062]|uniref:AGC/AKT protein kinase n=1 Tax=Thecamonas trahens ATCC 50062 TaxID=461836 RepID=A0A0L0D7S8_THETB|nr:AGC/AKT protein kinase [Thecamonas trahens ATCC 50062]KNC47363.1 AGC/AKT protein kinase [Thecamonas trahens ATCC 50062]|eukprot:XP_013759701.1 AGC/AKT protein kinase [Thecamonas trahens ATCC 50062]